MGARYGATAVAELPAKGTGGGGRSLAKSLGPVFVELIGEDGWHEVGVWGSATGASTAKRTILKRATEVLPEGHAFDIEARKTAEKESRLYARHVTDPDQGDE